MINKVKKHLDKHFARLCHANVFRYLSTVERRWWKRSIRDKRRLNEKQKKIRKIRQYWRWRNERAKRVKKKHDEHYTSCIYTYKHVHTRRKKTRNRKMWHDMRSDGGRNISFVFSYLIRKNNVLEFKWTEEKPPFTTVKK